MCLYFVSRFCSRDLVLAAKTIFFRSCYRTIGVASQSYGPVSCKSSAVHGHRMRLRRQSKAQKPSPRRHTVAVSNKSVPGLRRHSDVRVFVTPSSRMSNFRTQNYRTHPDVVNTTILRLALSSTANMKRGKTSRLLTGMGRMTINKGNFSLLDSRVNSPYCHSAF